MFGPIRVIALLLVCTVNTNPPSIIGQGPLDWIEDSYANWKSNTTVTSLINKLKIIT